MFVCTFKACMLPLQSNDICRTPGPLHACSSPALSIAVRNCKNICNCSICFNSVILISNNVESISKPV